MAEQQFGPLFIIRPPFLKVGFSPRILSALGVTNHLSLGSAAMAVPRPIIALVTDFGHRDPYVGIMKGVMLSICPEVKMIDLCHEVYPQDVVGANLLMAKSYSYFPQGTIFVSVIDPEVGSDRNILVIQTRKYMFVAPDNGVLDFIPSDDIVSIRVASNPGFFLHPVSKTFHGRDIMAPVAAYLANGAPIDKVGPETDSYRRLRAPRPEVTENAVTGQVLLADGFGNLITNIHRDLLRAFDADSVRIVIGGQTIEGISNTFSDRPDGELVAYIGSGGTLEVAVNRGDASDVLKAGRDAAVTVAAGVAVEP
jgi:S-adenosylmethionine hydrolase